MKLEEIKTLEGAASDLQKLCIPLVGSKKSVSISSEDAQKILAFTSYFWITKDTIQDTK